METVGAYEAKTHLPKLIERVRKGEHITITKHGVPVAVLKPPQKFEMDDPRKAIAKMRVFRKRHRLNGLSIKKMIEQGRR